MPMSMAERERNLTALRLPGIKATLETRALQASQGNEPFLEIFSYLLQDEMDFRRSRLIERRYKASGLDERKTLEENSARGDQRRLDLPVPTPLGWRGLLCRVDHDVVAAEGLNLMTPVHPGRILRRELAARELSANKLALALRVPSGRITSILNGKRGISPETALRLARYFGNSPRFWLNLQSGFDLAVAVRDLGARIEAEVSGAT